MQTLRVATRERCAFVDITDEVKRVVEDSGIERGLCLIHAPHTTAAITVQEGYDPDVVRDVLAALDRLVPHRGDYRHGEGNSAAHIKSLMTGSGQTLPIEDGLLQLGRWQAVFFCEFDGPRERRVQVQIVGSDGSSQKR